MSSASRRVSPEAPTRRGWCPSLARPMSTGDGLLARVHPPLGLLTVAQVRAVAEAARRSGNGHVDVTARGNLQIRGVTEGTAAALAAHLAAAGLGDVRGDGGPQRLTLTSPLAGLDSDDAADVLALAAAIERAGLAIPGLPAKTLVVIEGGGLGAAEADVIVRPVAGGHVMVAVVGGEDSAAGSIAVSEPDVASAVASVLQAFAASGARRVRDLSKEARAALLNGIVAAGSIGGASRQRSYSECSADRANRVARPHLEKAADRPISCPEPHPGMLRSSLEGALQPASRSLEPSFEAAFAAPQDEVETGDRTDRPDFQNEGAGTKSAPERLPRAKPTSSEEPTALSTGSIPLGDGRVAVAVEAPFGRCDAGALDRLAKIAQQSASGQPVRTSPNRGFVLVCETGERAADALRRLAAAGFVTEAGDPRRAVAACPGAPACASGSTATILDAGRLAQAFAPLAAAGLSAHVSGCAKGCAKPGAADLTLVGKDGRYGVVLRDGPAALPAFELTFEAALDRVRSAASTLSLDDAFRTTS